MKIDCQRTCGRGDGRNRVQGVRTLVGHQKLVARTRAIIDTQVIIITAVVTGLVNYILFPTVALCGASGVVFAFILLTSFTSFKNGEIPLTFILVAVIFLGQQVYEGVFLQDNISNLSHVLGGIIGSVVGFKLNKKR